MSKKFAKEEMKEEEDQAEKDDEAEKEARAEKDQDRGMALAFLVQESDSQPVL